MIIEERVESNNRNGEKSMKKKEIGKRKKKRKRLTIKQKKSLLIFAAIILVGGIIYQFASSRAQPLENDVRVAENSDLTYYLDIEYAGKDEEIVSSSTTASIKVYSDFIYVEDKLPTGLTFKEFINSEDGSIGASKIDDATKTCPGYVVDGHDGLDYNAETNMVSFKIKNLQAGCKITVGITTTTPKLAGRKRMDFYNTAYARENAYTTNSNTVHVFMGKEEATLYNVSYEYTGDVPENAPAPPITTSYPSGISVGVANDIDVAGYTFSGWETEDVEVTNGTFTMPEQNVTLKGHFEKKPTYTVSYKVTGETPKDFTPPKTKSYGEGDDVVVNSLKVGDEVDGYRFLGWETTDVQFEETKENENTIFKMPNHNVELTGRFEVIRHTVSYEFQGSTLPPNASSLLPEPREYKPKEIVTRAEDVTAEGYHFLGWYKEESFEMPNEDVVIYGEWTREVEYFAPTIEKEIPNKQASYANGEKVPFQITVTNTANYEINDVMVEEHTEGSHFIAKEGYEIVNDRFAKIPTLPANSSIVLNAEYTAGEEVSKTVTNEVEITGAVKDTSHVIDTTKKYTASVTFKIANIGLRINKVGEENEPLEGAEFTLYEDDKLTKEISSGLSFTKLHPGHTYYLKETKTKLGYVLLKDTLEVVVDDLGTITVAGYDIETENGLSTVTIANKRISILPNTGGLGIIPYIILGFLVVLGGTYGIMNYLKRKGGKR